MSLVLRGETKYLERRVERVRATAFVDDVYTVFVELDQKTITKRRIRVYNIRTINNININERSFHYGNSFRGVPWRRNSRIEFDGTLYKLEKCKGKNDQKPGPKEIWEIRNPRNVRIIELETNNKYHPKKKKRRKSRRRRTNIRKKIKALENEQSRDIEQERD